MSEQTTAARLRAARLNKGLSTRGAAKAMRIARATLERAERGEAIYPSTALKIAEFYGCRPTDFWPVEGADNWDGTDRREA